MYSFATAVSETTRLSSRFALSLGRWSRVSDFTQPPSVSSVRLVGWLFRLVLTLLRSSILLSFSLPVFLSTETSLHTPSDNTLTHYYFCLPKLIRIIYSRCTRLISLHSHDYPRVRSNPSHILNTTTHGWRYDRGVTLSASHAATSLLRPGRPRRIPTLRRYPHHGYCSPLTRHPAEQWRLPKV